MNKKIIASILISAALLTGCEGIEIISKDEGGTLAPSTGAISGETEVSVDENAWKTATVTNESSFTTVETTTTTESETTTVPTTTEEVTSETQEETTVVVESEFQDDVTSQDSVLEENTVDTESDYSYSFTGTVISAERKYVVVKPDVESDEFEISRRIVVYTNKAVDYDIKDKVEIRYSGEFGEDYDDMPTITGEIEKLADGEEAPSVISDSSKAEVEIVRVYQDGILVELLDDSGSLSKGTRATINMRDGLIFEKGEILEIIYSAEVETPDNDYPIITIDEYDIKSAPSSIIGEITAVNDQGVVVELVKTNLEIEPGASIVVVSDRMDSYSEGDRIKIIFTDLLDGEPYIIYDVTESYLTE